MNYEYKVIPAPTKGLKAKGVKSGADRFANALQTAMNAMAANGWEYLRAETLPSEEREGLMGKTTVFQNVLIFGRIVNDSPDSESDEKIVAAEQNEDEEQNPSEETADQEVEDAPELEDDATDNDVVEDTVTEEK